ncbi:BRCA1-associated RING domain protein 1 [Osmerus mordax]|uniref:BRCA1-associated RING domain protein 1 n=1 Tax=Osmerus mordax TaxID=8014 RepID=UPI00350F0D1A
MDQNAFTEVKGWTRTREAIADFRKLLLCSRCLKLMNEPVCLGICEHMLCRSCAGPQAGAGCVVCHSPAWVKDIQINRQLSNITDLFRSLDSLLNPTENSDPSPVELETQPSNSVLKQKKNYKIWFSPRSRKVRCRLENPTDADLCASGGTPEKPTSTSSEMTTTKSKDLSIYNFNSSSQDSDPSSPKRGKGVVSKKRKPQNAVRKPAAGGNKPTTRKQTKQAFKRNRLEAINEQWGIGIVGETQGEKISSGEGDHMSNKRVSFLSPAILSGEMQPEPPQGESIVLSPNRSILKGAQTENGVHTSDDQDQSSQSPLTSPSSLVNLSKSPKSSQRGVEKDLPRSPKITPKRARVAERGRASQSTPKRPRASTSQGRRPEGPRTPVQPSPRSPASPNQGRMTRNARGELRGSPGSPASVGKRSPGTPGGSGGKSSQSSPAFMKRNFKGETPLHLAAIKGEVEAVKELLEQGADPNLKDNAGWTPLHEACNLGHQRVVEVLLREGALLNTPGYENDSPLHDAARNGHAGIARLLLEHGASQSVLNMFGLRPVDCAVSPEMQAVFEAASKGPHPAPAPLSPLPSVYKVSDGVSRDERVVVLASKLSKSQHIRLTKLSQTLGGTEAESFSSSVTHVVVPDGPMPTTLTTLLGVLSGCWVLGFSWVEKSLQAASWAEETEHEAEGPQRSRMNRRSLLPPLFDGCFFFFLGSFKNPPRQVLLQLVKEGGGQVLSRHPKPHSDVTQTLNAAAYHALPGSDQALCTQYIIYDPQGSYKPPRVRLGKVWSAPSSWIISCVSAFQLLPVS